MVETNDDLHKMSLDNIVAQNPSNAIPQNELQDYLIDHERDYFDTFSVSCMGSILGALIGFVSYCGSVNGGELPESQNTLLQWIAYGAVYGFVFCDGYRRIIRPISDKIFGEG